MFRLLSILVFLSPTTLNAEPYVIYDSGTATSTASYTKILSNDQIPDFRETWIFNELPESRIDQDLEPKDIFPITTQKLSPMRLTETIGSYFTVMAFPICIVGTDDLSREWIKHNKKHLLEISAHCLLVEAPNAKQARSMLDLMEGIFVFPAHGDAIAEYFKIQHYPVLITERYISQ